MHCARKVTVLVADCAVDAHLLHFESHPGRGIGCELVVQREVDNRVLVDLVLLIFRHAALPEEARHIELLAEVLHRLLEQCVLIHVELLLLLAPCSLGSDAACSLLQTRTLRCCTPDTSLRDGFYFFKVTDFYWSKLKLGQSRTRADSELQFHSTTLRECSRGPSADLSS